MKNICFQTCDQMSKRSPPTKTRGDAQSKAAGVTLCSMRLQFLSLNSRGAALLFITVLSYISDVSPPTMCFFCHDSQLFVFLSDVCSRISFLFVCPYCPYWHGPGTSPRYERCHLVTSFSTGVCVVATGVSQHLSNHEQDSAANHDVSAPPFF